MAIFRTYNMPNSTILRVNSDKDTLDLRPEYQRNGGLWSIENRQLLIDSILNDYDLPKLYFHKLDSKTVSETGKEYAVVDGRQRIETVFSFLDDEFALDENFKLLSDDKIQAGNLTYSALSKKYPKLKIKFDSFVLPITIVETDDIGIIEDMFSRLNEAVSLNAAEKRNAFGGDMAKCIIQISQHAFFKNKVRFKNSRFQHQEAAVRLLFLFYCLNYSNLERIVDTKKIFLDSFVKTHKSGKKSDVDSLRRAVTDVLLLMTKVFASNDPLLRSQSIIPIYFLVFWIAAKGGQVDCVSRDALQEFRTSIENNKIKAIEDISKANFDLLEFDRLSQQGTNDAGSIRQRTKVLLEHLNIKYDIRDLGRS